MSSTNYCFDVKYPPEFRRRDLIDLIVILAEGAIVHGTFHERPEHIINHSHIISLGGGRHIRF